MSNNVPSSISVLSEAERDQVLQLSRNSPPPEQIPQLLPTLASIQSNAIMQVQLLDSQISELKSKLRTLEQHRANWLKHQSQCQSLLAPIRSIPTELVQLVFENFILYDDEHYQPGVKMRRPCSSALTRISTVIHVSHHWRSVALACSRLWTSFHLDQITEKYLNDMVLPRTVHCKLDVSVLGERNKAKEFISLYSHLIQRLLVINGETDFVASPDGWANLTHLHYQHRWPKRRSWKTFSAAPKLHTMSFDTVDIPQSSFPWVQIRSLTLQISQPEDLRTILPMAANLEFLALIYYSYSDPIVPILSSSVNTLQVINSSSAFSSLTLPNLRTIHFKQHILPQLSLIEFDSFQTRSQCRITVLSIIDMKITDCRLVEFLGLIPTLQDLTLGMLLDVDAMLIDSLHAAHDSTVMLPKLKSLSLKSFSIHETSVVKAVLSRRHSSSSSVSCLEFVSVEVTAQVFNAVAIEPMVQLRAGGLRIILQDRCSRY